jgi:hypothetical protein
MDDDSENFDAALKNFMKGPSSVNMDGAPQWGSTPETEGQFENEKLWTQDSWHVNIFDLSNEEHISSYEELLTNAGKQDPEVVILEQEKQFCKTSENWKIFLTTVNIVYKQTINEKAKS